MKKFILMVVLVVFTLQMVGCAANVHTIGKGSQHRGTTQKWQWYALWGLIPLNEVDTQEMAEGASDYKITTKYSFLNLLTNGIGGYVSIHSRTVEVKR